MTRPGDRAPLKSASDRGRPFDFRLHRARRCAKLIRCVSIFARKPANVTQGAAKPISITARSSNIPSKSSDGSADPTKDLCSCTRSRPARRRQVQGKKERRAYISRRESRPGSASRELRAYSRHATRFSTLLQLCNTSAAPPEP